MLVKRGYGYADLENEVPIDENSSFRLASVSKQFTTMAVMLLVEDGVLAYDDPLVKHIPELDTYPGVTLRHMMHHTSGIPDFYEKGFYEEYDAADPMPQNSDLVDVMTRYPEPDFAPGEKYVYNNAAYELLAVVVERVSGMPFPTFMEERVFRPAGMRTATTFSTSRADIPNRVYGYEPSDDGYELYDYDPFNDILGSGGVYASLNDFAAWDVSLTNNGVASEDTLRLAYTSAQLTDGSATGYGFGWSLGAYRGHRFAAHGGSWVGFRTHFARYPELGLAIAVLTNQVDAEPGEYVQKIVDILLDQHG